MEIEVPPLAPASARTIAQTYLQQTGALVESPALFIAHLVQQANGNPQALADARKERRVDKRKIREMRHAAVENLKQTSFTVFQVETNLC